MSTRIVSLPNVPEWMPDVDRVWVAIALVFTALLILVPHQAIATFSFTISSLLDVAPFLISSIAIAAYAQASGADNLIANAFQGRIIGMIVVASIFGALSPFCSCGVIPLIAALLAMGVPLAPVMAFWLASPIMDPAMFAITTGVLGTTFAIAKTIAAIGIGLFGGLVTLALVRTPFFTNPLREGVGDGGCGGRKVRAPQPVVWRFWEEAKRQRLFLQGALKNLLFLGKWLTLAFVLESVMLAYVPADFVIQFVGDGGWLAVTTATLVGVPAYLNGFAALPLVDGLISQGMAPGAALAFLVAGGVTSIPAAIAVFALTRPPVFFTYLLMAFTGSIAAGLTYQWLVV